MRPPVSLWNPGIRVAKSLLFRLFTQTVVNLIEQLTAIQEVFKRNALVLNAGE